MTVPQDAIEATVGGLQPDTTYRFVVEAKNALGSTSTKTPVCATTLNVSSG